MYTEQFLGSGYVICNRKNTLIWNKVNYFSIVDTE